MDEKKKNLGISSYATEDKSANQHNYEKEIESLKKELKMAQEEAHIYKQIVENLSMEGVFLADRQFKEGREGNNIVYVNRIGKKIIHRASSEIKEVFGYDIDGTNIQGRSIHTFHKNPERVKELLKETKPGEIRKNADIPIGNIIIESNRTAITDLDGNVKYYLATWIDITSTKDHLTGLYNRRFIYEYWSKKSSEAIRKKEKIAILIMDIDDFKKINDTYGHDTGDVVLRVVANTTKESVRDMDIVCRWGGEEFVVVLPSVKGSEEILTIAERIRVNINNKTMYSKNGDPINVSVSLGVTVYPDEIKEPDFDKIVSLADEKLYKAKKEGKNRVVV